MTFGPVGRRARAPMDKGAGARQQATITSIIYRQHYFYGHKHVL